MKKSDQQGVASKPDTIEFLKVVEFNDAALFSYVTSGIVLPAYDAIKQDFGIIRGEYLLLVCLSHYPVLTAQDVARLTGRPRNTISRAVNRMLQEKYLDRVPDPLDGRQAKLTITKKGKKLHEEVVKYLLERERLVLEVLNDRELKELRKIMRKLAEHTSRLRD
ncbi:MAG: MarR family transcriptional regulator [Pseudomonadota bacterium]